MAGFVIVACVHKISRAPQRTALLMLAQCAGGNSKSETTEVRTWLDRLDGPAHSYGKLLATRWKVECACRWIGLLSKAFLGPHVHCTAAAYEAV
jgi:hypothetical protein